MPDHSDIDHTGLTGIGTFTNLDIPTSTSPAQTTEGRAVWDSDDDKLTIGTGAARKTLVNEGAATGSGLTMATARLLGRTTASTGAIEEITVGSGLSLAAGALTATGGSSGIPAGSGSFPGSPSTGDQYFRTDRGIAYYYNGTNWLSMHVETVSFPPTVSLTSITGTANVGRLPVPWRGVYQLYIVQMDWFFNLAGVAHSGTNYYTLKCNWADTADSDTQIGSTINSQAATSTNSNYSLNAPIGVVLSTSARELKFRVDKVASGADMTYCTGTISYRLVG